uniref:Uncharacterized protein n=1 Tax=viral metagenome TaxID=1070528 RepID=A0A6C0LZ37_9ZZZZ
MSDSQFNIITQRMSNFQCQLINIITHKKDIYRLIYSVLYLCIIIMICIFAYWDIIYKKAKKYSKCNNISKIIDELYYSETPYIYNIIIINTNNIKKPADFIIKITYNFNNMTTNIEYGKTDNEENIFIHRKNDYIDILDDIKKLEEKKEFLNKKARISKKNDDLLAYNETAIEYSLLINSEDGKKALELNNNKEFIDTFKYMYYNLNIMNYGIIEDISTKINSNNYKYYAVNKNYNIIHSYTTDELIKFTKEFSNNSNYPITIIDYIIFSKTHQKNNINI